MLCKDFTQHGRHQQVSKVYIILNYYFAIKLLPRFCFVPWTVCIRTTAGGPSVVQRTKPSTVQSTILRTRKNASQLETGIRAWVHGRGTKRIE